MTQEKSHCNCKYFGHMRCPHTNDEIMKLATQDIPQLITGVPTYCKFPDDEEVDKICSICASFALHTNLPK